MTDSRDPQGNATTGTVPVSASEYTDAWIDSAWGDRANADLLAPRSIRSRPRVTRALQLARVRPGLTVLDIACGRGEVPAIVCQRGAYAIGLDYSEASLRFARRVQEVHTRDLQPPGYLALTQADAGALPFADECFDRITMLDIIEHLLPPQLERMFGEVRRVLRPDGFAVLHTLPNRWVYDVTFRMLRRLGVSVPQDPRSTYERRVHVNEQDLPRLHRTLTLAGLRHRLWLEQHIPAQARWNAGLDLYGDHRDQVYARMTGPLGRLLELLSLTPLKLLICNDIFGILWKGDRPAEARLPVGGITERLTCAWLS